MKNVQRDVVSTEMEESINAVSVVIQGRGPAVSNNVFLIRTVPLKDVPSVSNVRRVVDGGTAGVPGDLVAVHGDELGLSISIKA